MTATEQSVELVSTKEIELFLPLMREIDFGDAFLLSMLHWCGIGKRSKPLEYWQVFLIHAKSQIVGVSGLHRQPGMPSYICWLGWFAIRPKFRRHGFGSAAIHQLVHCRAWRRLERALGLHWPRRRGRSAVLSEPRLRSPRPRVPLRSRKNHGQI
jgi:GNAT superfamily N-acetyltransferase